mgnify:CR=1 FL=1|tara:strand:+ start:202 stop:519 length:318 start_codon:yes stop_codon:yes gene_type:complete
MAVSIDSRPTVFGNKIVVTGTYAAADTSIDLSSMMSSIDMATATPTAPIAPQVLSPGGAADATVGAVPFTFGEFATVNGTTITVNTPGAAQATIGGTFMAIGNRG